ncbi:unnamed protein product, partial [Prorocentrum cordatum]
STGGCPWSSPSPPAAPRARWSAAQASAAAPGWRASSRWRSWPPCCRAGWPCCSSAGSGATWRGWRRRSAGRRSRARAGLPARAPNRKCKRATIVSFEFHADDERDYEASARAALVGAAGGAGRGDPLQPAAEGGDGLRGRHDAARFRPGPRQRAGRHGRAVHLSLRAGLRSGGRLGPTGGAVHPRAAAVQRRSHAHHAALHRLRGFLRARERVPSAQGTPGLRIPLL